MIVGEEEEEEEEEEGAGDDVTYWIEASRNLAAVGAYHLHLWLHTSSGTRQQHSGEAILEDWKLYVDWVMELMLHGKPKIECVTLEGALEDGYPVVREVKTGQTRKSFLDYNL